MAELELVFLLPLPGWPRAVVGSDFAYDGAQLRLADAVVLRASTRVALERGVRAVLSPSGSELAMRLESSDRGTPTVRVTVDGRPALAEGALRARPSASAWIHASMALAGSAAGFVASYLYLLRAASEVGDWALKMGRHMAGWHLLLVVTLFPASVWGQRVGIRVVQWTSGLFFAIHVGIALANLGSSDPAGHDGALAFFNAASGGCFLAAVLYGNRAYRDMDPVAALRAGRARGPAIVRVEA
jgi:hypothetical protein